MSMSPKTALNLAMVLISVLTSCAGFPTPCALIGCGAAPYHGRRKPVDVAATLLQRRLEIDRSAAFAREIREYFALMLGRFRR